MISRIQTYGCGETYSIVKKYCAGSSNEQENGKIRVTKYTYEYIRFTNYHFYSCFSCLLAFLLHDLQFCHTKTILKQCAT